MIARSMNFADGEELRLLLEAILRPLVSRPFAVRLPDGDVIPPKPPTRHAAFTIVLKRAGALRRMLLPPGELALGEAYLFDDFDIEGSLVDAFAFVDELELRPQPWSYWMQLAWRLWRLGRGSAANGTGGGRDSFGPYEAEGRRHTRARDERSARFHYDVSNPFYKLWLDERMVYSCAYFARPDETLDSAQRRKLALVCEKLQLKAGDRLLDIGCGWGSLVLYAAAEYGVEALGITVSKAQAEEANARIARAGLGHLCRVEVCHYESFYSGRPFDKIASIGMFEHVGPDRLGAFMRQVYGLLPQNGRFLLQGASTRQEKRHLYRGLYDRIKEKLGWGRIAFYNKYFFPDSHLAPIDLIVRRGEEADFEAVHVECLREHYALTLQHWLARLEASREAAVAEVGEVAYRCWRLLSAYSHYFMKQGFLTEYQTLFVKR